MSARVAELFLYKKKNAKCIVCYLWPRHLRICAFQGWLSHFVRKSPAAFIAYSWPCHLLLHAIQTWPSHFCAKTTYCIYQYLWPRHLQTLLSEHGRAISVQRLLTVIIVFHGRAICRLMCFKYGRAILCKNYSLCLSLCMAVPFANLCDLKSQNYGRAILLTTLYTTLASG